MQHLYRVVDVFTKVPLEGNPLAVFPDSDGIDEFTMQKIARELNLSETVFISPADLPGCMARLRIFTPTRELSFAGHPTIGASYVLLSEGKLAEQTHFAVQENIGPVPIRIEQSDRRMIWLTTPPISFGTTFDTMACARALGLERDDLLPVQPQIVDAGNSTLLIALKSKELVDRCSADIGSVRSLEPRPSTPFCIFVFATTEDGAYSRMFAPEFGVVEDPATGSSTGPLAAYMKRHDLLPTTGKTRFVSEQGTKMGRRSLLYFDVANEKRIGVGGHVVPVIEAVLTL